MGKQVTPNGDTEIGLFGYESGQRSIFLDSKTGNATFGKQGAGQIHIDARSDQGTIQSGDYPVDKNDTPSGMKIKFSSTGENDEKGPYIKFGTGDFSVTHDGFIHAKGGGDIAGWEVHDDSLTSPIATASNNTTYTPLKLGINQIVYQDQTGSDFFNVNKNGTARIAGWSFDKYKFSKNNAGINSVTTVDAEGSKTVDGKAVAFYAGDNKFYVTHDGYLKSVDGKIAASHFFWFLFRWIPCFCSDNFIKFK